jgi:hypothetical protein
MLLRAGIGSERNGHWFKMQDHMQTDSVHDGRVGRFGDEETWAFCCNCFDHDKRPSGQAAAEAMVIAEARVCADEEVAGDGGDDEEEAANVFPTSPTTPTQRRNRTSPIKSMHTLYWTPSTTVPLASPPLVQ